MVVIWLVALAAAVSAQCSQYSGDKSQSKTAQNIKKKRKDCAAEPDCSWDSSKWTCYEDSKGNDECAALTSNPKRCAKSPNCYVDHTEPPSDIVSLGDGSVKKLWNCKKLPNNASCNLLSGNRNQKKCRKRSDCNINPLGDAFNTGCSQNVPCSEHTTAGDPMNACQNADNMFDDGTKCHWDSSNFVCKELACTDGKIDGSAATKKRQCRTLGCHYNRDDDACQDP